MSDRPNRRGSRSGGPTRTQADLADVVELLLDKGIVINADIAVSIGDAELLGIQLRAAIASFETAAKYGLEFPAGTDTDRIEEIAGATSIDDSDEDREDGGDEDEELAIERSEVGPQIMGIHEPPVSEHSPAMTSAPITESNDSGAEGDDSDDGTDDGLSDAIDEAGDVVSGSDDGGSSEPGVRTRPTAPDADEREDDDEDDDSEGSDSDENAGTNGGSETDDESTADDAPGDGDDE